MSGFWIVYKWLKGNCRAIAAAFSYKYSFTTAESAAELYDINTVWITSEDWLSNVYSYTCIGVLALPIVL